MAGKVILRLVSQPLIVLTIFSHHVLVGARTDWMNSGFVWVVLQVSIRLRALIAWSEEHQLE